MVPVGDKPFLEMQMEHFASLGFRRFVLAVSYLWEQIRDYFGDGDRFGWQIEYSVEPEPLGTGGAAAFARRLWGPRALIANGDTFLRGDWSQMVRLHNRRNRPATMALVRQEDCSRFGTVEVSDETVTGFREKDQLGGPGWINAGVYVLDEEVFDAMEGRQRFSLETDVFPSLAGRINAFEARGAFADIGTPESLETFRRQQAQIGSGTQDA
jgi:NDP-sugar pyrophosphorylase family protein